MMKIWRDQRGSEPVAFIALLPLLVAVILLVLQIAAFGYSMIILESAARDAARAASSGDDAAKVVQDIANGTGSKVQLDDLKCPTGSGVVTVDVSIKVPELVKMPATVASDFFVLRRSVVILREGNCP